MRREKADIGSYGVVAGRSMRPAAMRALVPEPTKTGRKAKAVSDAAAVLTAAIALCQHAARRADVQIAVRNVRAAPVEGDALTLAGALDGLLMNAIARSPRGGFVVCAIVREAGAVSISVADQGRPLCGTDLARMLWPHAAEEGSNTAKPLDSNWLQSASALVGARLAGYNRGPGAGAVLTLTLRPARRRS